MSKLEIRYVSKYEEPWNPTLLFSTFRVRAVLVHSNDLITNIKNMANLKRRLVRELGTEDEDWTLGENPLTQRNELYIPNTGKLIMWKLQDDTHFAELFDWVEQHTDDAVKLQEQKDADKEIERAERQAEVDKRQAIIDAMIAMNNPPPEPDKRV